MKRGLILFILPAVLAGCGKKPTPPSADEVREAAVLRCVGDFKTELSALSKSHAELVGVGQFDHTHLGFTFVNDNVKPRIRISLSVEDGLLSEMNSVPVGAEELTKERIVCALQLECDERPELEAALQNLYIQFKSELAKELNSIPSNKPDAGDG
jgi:hypothetical protein